MTNRNALVPILASGAVAGTLDITSAFILSGWGVCRFIAAGLLGPEARHGGVGTWLLGLFLHFLIATSIAAVYCLFSRRLEFLVSHYLICSPFYGMAAYLAMKLIVLPLSALHAKGPYHVEDLLQGLLIHMFLVGLPIGFVNAMLTRQGRSKHATEREAVAH